MSMKNLYQIQEWKPSDMGRLSGLTGSVLVALYLGLTGRLRLPRFRVILVIGLVFETMQHVRNEQLFGVVAPLLIANSLGYAVPAVDWERILSGVAGLTAIVSLCFRMGFPLHRTDQDSFAPTALANVPTELRAKPVLNEYGFGGILIFSGIKPFIDGRADLYGDDMMETYLSIIHAKGDTLDRVLCRYRIAWTMFGPDTGGFCDHGPHAWLAAPLQRQGCSHSRPGIQCR